MRNDDTRAKGGAVKKADHEIDQRTRRAHGRQRVRPEELADYDRVCGVIELLEDLAEEDGQRKADDEAVGVPLSEAPGLLHPVLVPDLVRSVRYHSTYIISPPVPVCKAAYASAGTQQLRAA